MRTKLKNISRRGSFLLIAVAFLTSLVSALPFVASADNFFESEFSKRSLLLTSSAPGWDYLDGSGTTVNAPPGSGPNGKQTGETYDFFTTTDNSQADKHVLAFTFQYCTSAAGTCTAPGNGTWDPAATPDPTSNLDAHYPSPIAGVDFTIEADDGSGLQDISTGWAMNTSTVGTHPPGWVAEKNYITLTCDTTCATTNHDDIEETGNTEVRITFKASGTNYITNPGEGAFFVKMIDYNDDTTQDDTTLMDGGVTVANVMNQSIEIVTKVLETMTFSVGVADPDSYDPTTLGKSHGSCDPMLTVTPTTTDPPNAIHLGDPSFEYSLAPDHNYDAYSLWRLSSNSANGATVYYAGATLRGTQSGQVISGLNNPTPGSAAFSDIGTNEFGLGLNTDYADWDGTTYTAAAAGSYYAAHPLDNTVTDGYLTKQHASLSTSDQWLLPSLDTLTATDPYNAATGVLGNGSGPKFAFDGDIAALSDPQQIASGDSAVVHCATGQVRYVANVAPYTAAGIYTTKINYLAAPEY